jgi:hypothetical protein
LEPDGPPTALEPSPLFGSAEEAVVWGRSRTPRVFLRREMMGGYWWAGIGECPADDAKNVEGIYTASDG